MRQVLHVLLLALARFLHGCADFLARVGERPVPAVEASEFPLRTVQPPEDWLRRAAPPPPAHWLKTVRARAPGFLKEPAVYPRKGEAAPVESFPRNRAAATPPLPTFKGSEPKPAERAAALHLPVRTPRPDPIRRPTLSRSVRIVTVVEERPGRKPELPLPTPSNTAVKSSERQDPWTSNFLAPAVEQEERLSLVREAKQVRSPQVEPRQEPATAPIDEKDAWTPLFHPATDPVALPSVPGHEAFVTVDRPEERLPAPPVERPAFLLGRPVTELRNPASASVAGCWPELPPSDLGDDADDARLLLRELRRQAELECEQRGMPWSA